jgi:tetratricopeptide (TPR) repeat protein
LKGGLILDDSGHLTSPDLRSLHGLWRIWFDLGSTPQYYPLAHSAFWLEQKLWGSELFGYHLTNVLLHAAAALLVVAIVRRLALPAALLVVFWWQRGRLAWKRDVAPLLPWLAIGITAGLFTAWVERKYIGAEGPDFALTLAQRCLLPGRVIWFYLGKLLWPANLAFIYPRWTVDPAVWWQYLFPAGAVALAAGLWLVSRRSRGPLAGFLFFGGTLFPVLGFLNVYPFLYSYVADHYQYLASLGIIVPLASGLTMAAGRIPANSRWLAPVLAGLLLGTLGVLSWRQSGLYQNTVTLYTDTLAHNPGCWMAHNSLGRDLLDLPGRAPEAISHLHEALRLRPNNSMSHYNLGLAYEKLPDRLRDAIAEYEAALRIDPDFAEAHDNLGKVLLSAGRRQEAISEFRSALRLRFDDPRMHNNLGIALARTGQLPEAIAAFDAALRLKPDYADAHCNRGIALAQSGRLSEAIAAFETAQRIDPGSDRARRLLERWRATRQ